ncbi:MAG TPA: respiratory nitrate reductase subunit gamma [Bacteroidales bacterium]|nr:respiratory nitrate reductase subunit gamma [Bacteroidales bacterium]
MAVTFFFIVLPSLAIVSLLAGSLYRYFYHGFQVSSLSSQILESRILFFGSRPFHWGIVTLLIGHLIGFLIPRQVLAWNNIPARLYILEITAMAFALMTITGLGVLIYRRISVKRITLVTSKMDIFVFVMLVLVVVTGMYTAFFFRWGSSWFATVMTPYLRSVFLLNPDTAAISALPVMVKIHMIAAFIFIGMIPYTRIIHILVYPLHYLFREYQVVIWNKKKPSERPVKNN